MSCLGFPQSCVDCGSVSLRGVRCRSCASAKDRARRNPVRDTGAYRRATRAAVSRHVARHGYVCLGDEQHPAHPSHDLTADHPLAIVKGGSIDQELTVMCRSANSKKGAR